MVNTTSWRRAREGRGAEDGWSVVEGTVVVIADEPVEHEAELPDRRVPIEAVAVRSAGEDDDGRHGLRPGAVHPRVDALDPGEGEELGDAFLAQPRAERVQPTLLYRVGHRQVGAR